MKTKNSNTKLKEHILKEITNAKDWSKTDEARTFVKINNNGFSNTELSIDTLNIDLIELANGESTVIDSESFSLKNYMIGDVIDKVIQSANDNIEKGFCVSIQILASSPCSDDLETIENKDDWTWIVFSLIAHLSTDTTLELYPFEAEAF
ncbi:hypothetical protein [Photobacterium kishitanii]|uniref:Uncharacterized protein n=1 Tax=Photobacterium kishitanii TaxID=318456 RepID=A0A2T3KMH7_9GAMM|nr:hypothetical protein [Photobacterium kishitanii]PSV00984.1 hypothetical protein C9J27_02870 [Photobacterium kishitanii]